MALKKVKGNFERFFDKTLTDLVRGIRNNKDNEAKYIAQCIEEVKQELRQDNINVKCNAVAKLTYIQMLGYDISWAGFNIIEVMSSSKFTCKRVGYLAASQCFHPDSELIMLTTNMIRKDLNSQTQYDAGVALSGLSCFISSDLSRDLANDIMTLCSSTKPYLRMKAVLMMYKVFLRYPEALRPAFPKLKEKLEDPDPGVQSAAVNVICELARKNPKNYLSLAPIFFKLMTTSTNNWMLIKIIKLFGALTPLEPRLGKKLIEPLTSLIHSTSAMSLLYECINTVIAVLISISSGMPNHTASIQLCVQKLRILIEDSDQNLKYLGLLAMSKILKTHPKSVQAHKDLILACLDDKDESIRLRALDLLFCGKGGGMVSKKNLMEIVRRLLGHMERAEGSAYRDELLFKVIQICSQGSYQYVTNFEWYLTVLVELIQLEAGSKHGSVIAKQLLDVSIRVQAVRPFAVSEMTALLESFPETTQSGSMFEVLYAAAWIVGEFSSDSNEPERSLNVLLKHRSLPGHIQGVYVQNILKLFTRIVTDYLEHKDVHGILRLCNLLLKKLPSFVSSSHIEVQERASSAFVLIEMLRDQLNLVSDSQSTDVILSQLPTIDSSEIAIGAIEIVQEMALLFAGDLNPVAPKAQKKVQIPEGLSLDEWINTPPAESSESSEDEQTDLFVSHEQMEHSDRKTKSVELTPEEIMKLREVRKIEQSHNPNYLKSTTKPNQIVKDGCEDIPIAELALEVPLKITSTKRSDKYLQDDQLGSKKKTKKTKKTKKSKHKLGISSESDGEEPVAIHAVSTFIEMPEGASLSDNDDKDKHDVNDPHRALDIDLDLPLRTDEILPKQSYKKFNEIAPQLAGNNVTKKTEVITTAKSSNRDKKEKKRDKDRDGKKKSKHSIGDNEPDLIGTPVKHQKEKHKKEKKDKKGKEKKLKDSKTGYEEAIGISTPSKEVY
ncbi:AP-3 complex subunit delta isoform X2 [Bradysia coprophila]|uniref:AP-3 complex subunit delta isoform X2 n=2 Tax=Bradysia coprophila TaxID=38358 RepID=UPI00187D6F3B|nr:AP-3 complex subunit delta isoform X2 [Bradysia coprophila]